MPGSVANASVSVMGGNPLVLPVSLCKSFTETREWVACVNEYHDGSRQSMGLVSTSRRSWKIMKRLAPVALQALWDFWQAHPTDPFYFYNPKEPASGQPVGSNYDATGTSTQGRYTVVFRGDWQQTTYLPRAEVGLELIEVA
jgi:hypothetical protein